MSALTLNRLAARRVLPTQPAARPPVLLLHGLGLGAFFWERAQGWLAELGWESWAVDLPGHGAARGARVDLERWLDAATGCAQALGAPAVLGHSLGGLAALVVATRLPLHAAALISPAPCAGLPPRPPLRSVPALLAQAPAVLAGRAVAIGRAQERLMGLDRLPAAERAALLPRLSPWPAPLVREALLRPPGVERAALRCPVLMTHGLQDPVQSLQGARLLADHLDCVLWRFDDLAHNAPIEPGGERLVRAVAGWLARPHGRRVTEVQALGPEEGVGDQERRSRRTARVRSNSRFGRG